MLAICLISASFLARKIQNIPLPPLFPPHVRIIVILPNAEKIPVAGQELSPPFVCITETASQISMIDRRCEKGKLLYFACDVQALTNSLTMKPLAIER